MNSLWQRLTLSDLSPDRWVDASYVHRWVGSLQSWRQQSWLMQWGDEIGAILTSLVFVISPFIPSTPGLSTETIALLLVGVAAFWILLTLADNRGGGITPIHITLLVFWGISAVSTGLSPAKDAALRGLNLVSLYLVFFVMLARLYRSPRIRNWLIGIYLHMALIVSVYGVHQSIYGAKQLATWVDAESTLAKTTRVYSYLNNPNLLAGYLLPAIVFSVAACFIWRGWLPKTLAIVMVVVNTYCLQVTYSRGAWVGAFLGILVAAGLIYYWLRPRLPRFWRSWALPIALGGIIAIVGISLLLVPSLRDRVLSIFSGSKDSSNNVRLEVWKAVGKMIHDRPLFGFGPGDRVFKKIYPIYQTSPRFSALSAYSIFLETIVEIGYVGVAALLWSIVVTFNCGLQGLAKLRQARDMQAVWLIAAIVSMVALLGQGTTDTEWYRPQIQTLWWSIVGIIASFYPGVEQIDRGMSPTADTLSRYATDA
ncbi:IctB family putative bicarbonate transporter [Chamaesiphon minutus]|uniref:Putative bicarbonate transporter, IctB family n=1 Tax=Chamaesiphon minutus (strain ATCC 27169 / PCC 6605) TaxID=1173020 RepID=K9UF37_CHAP6|nr:IctB family putative bicarbonate transporter [Chamaesiphon minutus]AFY92799.1 putative bicarbonate transporter, IctB family [Chamaesiphon minutus PCC 6605]